MNRKGLTLIELLIALIISSVLIAAIYKTFISQQQTYTVQEQVVDMQQNIRAAINQMIREIRMAGFGIQNAVFWGADGMHGKYKNIIHPGDDGKSITIVGAYEEVTYVAEDFNLITSPDRRKIKIKNASFFDTGGLKYISFNGTESHRIKSITYIADSDPNKSCYELELFDELTEDHPKGEPVFRVYAITYSLGVDSDGKTLLLRNDNVPGGLGPQPVAENIESLRFKYTLKDGTEFWDTVPGNRRDEIRMVQVTIVARTDRVDPNLSGDGFRRRTLTTNIQLRNLIFS